METALKLNGYRSISGKIQAGSLILGLVIGVGLVGAYQAGRHSVEPPEPANQQDAAAAPRSSAALPNTVADIAAEAGKWTVNIDADRLQVQPPQILEFFSPFGPTMVPQPGQVLKQRGTGSGLIIRPDGYILTNNHVIDEAASIKVTLADKRVFEGKVVGRDPFTDLALIKIDAGGKLPSARIGSTKDLRPGDWAIAIGSPMGLDHSVTLGIISAMGRPIYEVSDRGQLIQTDAAINPGNSGGPLLNIKGEVIGINAAISGNGQNIGFAIPSEVFQDVSQQILAAGSVKRPYVGVQMQELTPKLAQQLGSPQAKGVVVAMVSQGSPADYAGLSPGDIITGIDNKPLFSSPEVRAAVRSHKVGDKIAMSILRKGKALTVTLTVGDFDADK